VYIDAGHFLPHIPPRQFPGQALVIELYLRGGIRTSEIGSVMFAHTDPLTGQMIHPDLELVRLAIPRRVYTQAHLDYVVEITADIASHREELHGLQFTYAPQQLRHFTARFEPV
jgi:tryptophanase